MKTREIHVKPFCYPELNFLLSWSNRNLFILQHLLDPTSTCRSFFDRIVRKISFLTICRTKYRFWFSCRSKYRFLCNCRSKYRFLYICRSNCISVKNALFILQVFVNLSVKIQIFIFLSVKLYVDQKCSNSMSVKTRALFSFMSLKGDRHFFFSNREAQNSN